MENIDLATVIQEAIVKFSRNRFGDKPPVSVVIPATLASLPWRDRSLKEFVRLFLYESLLTNDPEAAIQVSLRRRPELKDLNAFLGIHPSYWIQLRVSGRGLRIIENLIEDLFAEVGHRCEEWVGVEGSGARLGIFGPFDRSGMKIVFCIEATRNALRCDLLLPVAETAAAPCVPAEESDQAAARP